MKTSNFLPAGSSFTQVFDTRGMRRYFDLPVLKEMAALGLAHLLAQNSSKYTISIIPNLAREDRSKRCYLPDARASTEDPPARLTFV